MHETPREPIGGEEFYEPLPVPEPVLRGLLEHLDKLNVVAFVDRRIQLNCDHTMDKSLAYLRDCDASGDEMIEWLSVHGAGCDCEVLLNVSEHYTRVYGELE